MMPDAPDRFLLYIDILGFKEMTLREPRKVARIYAILDTLNAHRHPTFKTIVFSDTILVYNSEEVNNDDDRKYLVWYLTEFAEDLHRRLTGQNIWFRSILTSGQFNHYRLKNIECFFGNALISAYEAEKGLPLIGLAMHASCIPYNRYFRLDDFSDGYSFVYLNRQIEHLSNFSNNYPVKDWMVRDMAPDIAFDIRFLKDLYDLMRNHPTPAVRAKALTTWDFYTKRYPTIVSALIAKGFDLSALGPIGAWAENEKAVESAIKYFKRIGSGTPLSMSITKTKGKKRSRSPA